MTDDAMDDLPYPVALGPDADAENDPAILDLETFCAYCGLAHYKHSATRDCGCPRHIDGEGKWKPCFAAPPTTGSQP